MMDTMKVKHVVVAVVMGCSSAVAGAQIDQRAIAQQLGRPGASDKDWALHAALTLTPAETGDELRQALWTALEREAAAHRQHALDSRRGTVREMEDPERIFRMAEAVIRLQDPRAIPALAAAVFTGMAVPHALADFGERAVPAVIRTVMPAKADYNTVFGGLATLRFMVERQDQSPLSEHALSEIRRAARVRLTGRQNFTVLWQAIDLASVLDDPELTATVVVLASNRDEVKARGVDTPHLIDRTQQIAVDRLAGIPPLPRPNRKR